MKKHIKVKLINELNEESLTDTYAEYDDVENIINYYDKNVEVRVIIGDKIIIERTHPDYNLKLIFEENSKNTSKYEILNPKMSIDVEVDTMMLRRCNNNFFIQYSLKLNDSDMGLFSIDFQMEE